MSKANRTLFTFDISTHCYHFQINYADVVNEDALIENFKTNQLLKSIYWTQKKAHTMDTLTDDDESFLYEEDKM